LPKPGEDDPFAKAPVGLNDSATGKVDERTSLLPDGAPKRAGSDLDQAGYNANR